MNKGTGITLDLQNLIFLVRNTGRFEKIHNIEHQTGRNQQGCDYTYYKRKQIISKKNKKKAHKREQNHGNCHSRKTLLHRGKAKFFHTFLLLALDLSKQIA
jgi:hypothetical protein